MATAQTEQAIPPRRSRRPSAPAGWLWVIAAVALAAGIWAWYLYVPNLAVLEPPATPRLVIGGQVQPGSPLLVGDAILLPLDAVRDQIDPNAFWDEKHGLAIITTRDRVIRMAADSLTAFVNQRPVPLTVPVTVEGRQAYLPADILADIYGFSLRRVAETNTVVIDLPNVPVQTASVTAAAGHLRTRPTIRAPLLGVLPAEAPLRIYGEEAGWYAVRSETGLVGYIREDEVQLRGMFTPIVPAPEPYRPKPPGGKIVLTWEHVTGRNPDTSAIGSLGSLNVVSPTWFHLLDDEGLVGNNADAGYVRWARSRGYQVWGLADNGFDPARTHAVLSDSERRERVIRQLLAYAALYRLDGINIDFENIYLADKPLLVQFMRELVPLAHEQGLTVSIDVTVKSTSPNWSLCYDRAALGKIVDYVILMAYDEHPANSRRAGSVASLPWVERGIAGVLAEVPAAKLVLGVPFYTRLWTEQRDDDGKIKVSSKAVSMSYVRRWIQETGATVSWDERAGQYLARHAERGLVLKVWLEDERSMALRAALVKKYNLAGIASWRRGFEEPGIWHVIAPPAGKES